MQIWLKSAVHAALLSFAFAAMVIAAAPKLGMEDIPELPKPDGSGDTPEMIVDLVQAAPGTPAAKANTIKLSSLYGKVTLLDMFWSKCPHCEEHAPHVVAIYNQYRDKGFSILGLATDRKEDPAAVKSVKEFLTKTKINYQVGFITNEVVAYYADSHNHGVPQMILFGADGKMVFREIGWNESIEKKLKAAIEEQLAKAPPVKAPASSSAPAAPVKPGSKASAKPAQQKTKRS
ncbi:MAG: TlpA disulfide reductase family protein [Acidobacteriota bacterium]|nr:TlpA disulfide reductase family protein [Acidobacteriota bacterium]